MPGDLYEIDGMEVEGDVQDWQKRIQQFVFGCHDGMLASDAKYIRHVAVLERLSHALSDAESPFESNLRQRGATVLQDHSLLIPDKMLSDLAKLLLQGRFFKATQYYLSTLPTQARQTGPYNDLMALYDHWGDSYYGDSVKAFLANIYRYESAWSRSGFYCKALSIIQSSGTGKSRLVDEISKEFLSLSFVLRLEGETGYPPGDHEITKYLRSGIRNNMVGLLAGVIEHREPSQPFLFYKR